MATKPKVPRSFTKTEFDKLASLQSNSKETMQKIKELGEHRLYVSLQDILRFLGTEQAAALLQSVGDARAMHLVARPIILKATGQFDADTWDEEVYGINQRIYAILDNYDEELFYASLDQMTAAYGVKNNG